MGISNFSDVEVQIEIIRNASVAIEGIYVRFSTKSINEIQAFLKIYQENEKIQRALTELRGLGL